MKTASIIGSGIVTFALILYSIAFAKERKNQLITNGVLLFYSLGVSFDITATVFMIIGSSKGLVTLHGLIGYSSLLGMLTDTLLLWRFRITSGSREKVSRGLHLYSGIAYTWWIIAYVTGGLLVAVEKMMK
jgi:hypothetical protein